MLPFVLDPETSPYAFTKNEGSTPTADTGPSAGVGGSGPYVYAETSRMKKSDLFTLTYDGSVCFNTGLNVSAVIFYYHMYGAMIGELRVTDAAGEEMWSLSGEQGGSWQAATVAVDSPSFAFKYRIAAALVTTRHARSRSRSARRNHRP